MDDRTLLELAARAAEYTIAEWAGRVPMVIYPGRTIRVEWNPLTDDGDALRLAVKLGLEIYHSINNDRWTVFVGHPKNGRIVYAHEEWEDDECSATRRAIVRAAAEIGKGMN